MASNTAASMQAELAGGRRGLVEISGHVEELFAYIGHCKELVEAGLERFLPAAHVRPAQLHEAMRYSVLSGGKRLRAVLCMAGAQAVGGPAVAPESLLPTACAVELLHAASLICDDLPALDDSATRRGRPTCHVRYGESMAILAAHALSGLAFELVARQADFLPGADVPRVLALLAEAAGSRGMIAGEVEDLRLEGRPYDAADLHFIHTRKTGAFIRASLLAGAYLARAESPDLSRLDAYASSVGLAFQITDDVLDEIGQAETLGKPARADRERGKPTFVSFYGLETARAMAEEQVSLAIEALSPLGEAANPLRWLAGYILARQH
jgi:geranylgeranyl pyrophosphate synthase